MGFFSFDRVDNFNPTTVDVGRLNTRPKVDIQTLSGKLLRCFLGNFLISCWQKIIERLQNGDLGSQPIPDTAQLESDYTGTNHA